MTDVQSAIQRALYQAALEGDASPRITLSERVIEILMGERPAPEAGSVKIGSPPIPEILDRLHGERVNQTELADKLGIHPSAVSKMLAGKRQMKVSEIAPIVQYLELVGA